MSTTKTTESDPLRVDYLPHHALGLRGRLGMTFAPGKQHRGAFGQWNRDLDADLDRLLHVYRTGAIVSLVQDHELEPLGISQLFSAMAEMGLRVIRFPIDDGGIPTDAVAFRELVTRILTAAMQGDNVVVHCRGGLGRTGLVAACCLVAVGMGPAEAISTVRRSRPRTLETDAQERYVHAFAVGAEPFPVASPGPPVSRFVGSLIGGAIGDALGYPVEFVKSSRAIFDRHGTSPPKKLPSHEGHVRISDDTQMTLFTAEAIIRSAHRLVDRGVCSMTAVCSLAYQRWLTTQDHSVSANESTASPGWLIGVQPLHARRAPGNTCMSALRENVKLARTPTIETPPNSSKGCGAVMRSTPFGLAAGTRERAFQEARDAAVLTHGHPSGYLSAAYFASVVHDVARDVPLAQAMAHADLLLAAERGGDELARAVARVRAMASEGPPSASAIEELGGGWTGEEALAIALLCALTAEGSDAASTARVLWRSVAHAGDSDSTGSLTGNLLGAMHGVERLPTNWLADLELHDVIERVAVDLHASSVLRTVLDFESYPPS